MNAQPPPPPPPPPPDEPARQQAPPPPAAAIPAYRGVSDDSPTGSGDGKAGAGWRVLAVIWAIVLGFVAAVVIALMVDVNDVGVCSETVIGDCYDFSKSAKPFVLAFGWAAGLIGVLTALASLVLAIRGRGGRAVLIGSGVAIACGAVSILVAQVS